MMQTPLSAKKVSVKFRMGENPKKPGTPNNVRHYSAASTRYGDNFDGNTASLCVRRAVNYDHETGKEDPSKKGVCSNFLCDCKPGDKIKVTGLRRQVLGLDDFGFRPADDMNNASPAGKRRLRDLLLQKDNRVCADCGAPDPKWASANIGVFICLKCCGVHRSLGPRISKVLSVTLDDWSDDEIDAMVEVGGNDSANSIYEAYIPDGCSKPGPDSSHEDRAKFISSKYELQEFLKPSLRISSLPGKKSSLQASLSKKILDGFRSTSAPKNLEGITEYIGALKVKVVKGSNLAVRDMLSSDPYVVLTLGPQKVQTSVVKSNLNPVWNEELTLSVPDNYGPIKLEVYDYDTFSADDIMGEAEIDIQPMLTSAMAFGDAAMFQDMQIGKWLKSNDNALIEDSIVNIVDGKVKQDVFLKLQNVESGELDLELEWQPI